LICFDWVGLFFLFFWVGLVGVVFGFLVGAWVWLDLDLVFVLACSFFWVWFDLVCLIWLNLF